MSLTLITRAGNGAPLSATQNDQNMNDIMTEVNATEVAVADNTTAISTINTTIATLPTTASVNALFDNVGGAGGKGQIDASNVINLPGGTAFRAVPNGVDQQLSVTGGVDFHGTVVLNSIDFDTKSAFNTGSYAFTAPVTGIYMLTCSGQIYLQSGSPTGITTIINIAVNGAGRANEVLNQGNDTGNAIYRIADVMLLTTGDVVTVTIDISQTGDSIWGVSANENTDLSGFLVLKTA